MKKLLSAVITLLLVIGISVPAFADLGAPYFKEYEIRIINKDGVYLTNNFNGNETFIPYDTVLTVTGDYIQEDGTVSYSVRYGDEWGSISSNDAVLLEDGMHYSEGVKLDEPRSYIVIDKGVRIYKGPGYGYESVSEEISVGTEFDCYYAINDSSDTAWAYTTINGISGWIYVYPYSSNTVARRVNQYSIYGNDLYVVKEGVRLLDISVIPYQPIGDEIPVGTRLTFKYYIDDVKRILVQTEYNGVTGWISADEWYNDETENKVAIGKITAFWINSGSYPIYSELGNTLSEVIGMIESNQVVKTVYSCLYEYCIETYDYNYEYYESSWYGVEVNGQLGWINITRDWDREYIWDNVTHCTATEDEVEIHSTADSDDVIGTIPNGKDLVEIHSKDNKSYVCYDGINGWVNSEEIKAVVKGVDEYGNEQIRYHSLKDYFSGKLTTEYLEAVRLGKEITSEEDDGLTTPSPEEATEAAKKNKRSKKETEEASFTQTQIIILCASGVAVVAATAIIIIVLINKKKKQ